MRPTPPHLVLSALLTGCVLAGPAFARIPDTGQGACYDDSREIPCPLPGEPFFGQDAQYSGPGNVFTDNRDGTVTDHTTGLVWQRSPYLERKVTFAEASRGAESLDLGGHADWRLPTITELYSLIDFRGSSRAGVPYIDTDYFDFSFGDPSRGERTIDSQYWSSTGYVGTVFDNQEAVFGVNFADGRIKAYPRFRGRSGSVATHWVRYVRGNPGYGANRFIDNGDGTISDLGSGLVWQKADSGHGMNWQQALAYAEGLQLAGHDDWRLPNAKELQSLVDYERAPDAVDSRRQGAAIDPIFELTNPESWYWTSTSLLEAPPLLGWGSHAVYISFGQAFGVVGSDLINVHGAGAQRSDPKSGDPGQWAEGFGPQNDQIRILNLVRCVRGGEVVYDPSPSGEAPEPPQVTERGSSREPRQLGAGAPERSGTSNRGHDRPRGPVPCSTPSDCSRHGACPPGAALGCTCTLTPEGSRACIPACSIDTDCPSPPGRTMRCGQGGVCVPASSDPRGRRPGGGR